MQSKETAYATKKAWTLNPEPYATKRALFEETSTAYANKRVLLKETSNANKKALLQGLGFRVQGFKL
jgi:hypothetical protein